MTMFVTASKDNTAKLFDSKTLEDQKTFWTEHLVNSAALSPNYDHVVLGGGQEAMDVTTTSTRIGKFEARFFHLTFEEEFGRVKGHFGPINSVAFHPNGKSYNSGGKGGYVHIHYFTHSTLNLSLRLKKLGSPSGPGELSGPGLTKFWTLRNKLVWK
ncbi:Eukaryotic translation initiation factor 3 subunit I [Vulpes lagopus]